MKYRTIAILSIALFSSAMIFGPLNPAIRHSELWSVNEPFQDINETISKLIPVQKSSTPDKPSENQPLDNRENTQTVPYWKNHDLQALPVIKNTSAENLPTINEVENILFHWRAFKKGRGPLWLNLSGTREEILETLEEYDFEYHTKSNGLIIDTPGVILKKPEEAMPQNAFVETTDSDYNQYRLWNRYIHVWNSLDLCRRLENFGIRNGIAAVYIGGIEKGAYPQAKVVVPVVEGLLFLHPTGGEYGAGWTGQWTVINLQPDEPYHWWGKGFVKRIRIHWRTGLGDYEIQKIR